LHRVALAFELGIDPMKMHRWFGCVWIVSGLLASAAAQDGLAVRIELDGTVELPTCNFEEPFRVVLVNNSDRAIRIWNPETEKGFYQLSFRFKNLRTGESYAVRKLHIDEKEFWESLEERIDPNSATIQVAPKDTLPLEVRLADYVGDDGEWEGLPAPNSGDRFEIWAQFESAVVPAASRETVWTGKIESASIIARFVAAGMKTPHDYLSSGFSRVAIEMMSADPRWISRKDANSCTPLHHAARHGLQDAVEWLLDHGADVNAIAYNGFTPLLLTDDERVIELILRKHPNLAPRGPGDETPLQAAAANLVDARRSSEQDKWRRIMKLYIKSGAEYDIVTAIRLDDLERVKEIVKKSPASAHQFQGRSPLRTAAGLGRLDICLYLIEQQHVDVNDFEAGAGYPVIKEALAYPRVVELIIKSGADLKTRITWQGGRSGPWIVGDDATALHHAAADGVPETITLLIDHGVDIFATAHDLSGSITDQTALEVAAWFGKADNAMAIVNHPNFDRADAQRRQRVLDKSLAIGVVPFRTGGGSPQPLKLVEALLDKGANPNGDSKGVNAVQRAARQIHPNAPKRNSETKQMIALLRVRGAIVDLFSAVAIGDEEDVRRSLKSHPESAQSRAYDGYPALHFAVAMNYKNVVRALLDAGCEINIRNRCDNTGCIDETALHCAAFWGREEIARLLIDAGADVNALTDRKSTPLHDAARSGHVKIARMLLEKGAKPEARDKDNETPLDWCHKSKPTEAAEIEKVFRDHEKASGGRSPVQPPDDHRERPGLTPAESAQPEEPS
jgi:ankyrin repeat protein